MPRKYLLLVGSIFMLAVGCDQLTLNPDDEIEPLPAPGGMAVRFDGVDDYATIDAAAASLALSDFTVEMWFRLLSDPDNDATNAEVIFSADQGWDNQIQFYSSGTSSLGYHEHLSGAEKGVNMPTSDLVGVWHHLALRKAGQTLSFLLDGGEIGNITTSTNIQAQSTLSLAMQRNNPTPAQFWNGDIDELRLWNFALTDDQIKDRMSTELDSVVTASIESGLVGYWRFEAQSDLGVGGAGANDIEDESANDYHLDLSGATLVSID